MFQNNVRLALTHTIGINCERRSTEKRSSIDSKAINVEMKFRVSIFEQFLPAANPASAPDRAVQTLLTMFIELKRRTTKRFGAMRVVRHAKNGSTEPISVPTDNRDPGGISLKRENVSLARYSAIWLERAQSTSTWMER
jgi:hypothetical protein